MMKLITIAVAGRIVFQLGIPSGQACARTVDHVVYPDVALLALAAGDGLLEMGLNGPWSTAARTRQFFWTGLVGVSDGAS